MEQELKAFGLSDNETSAYLALLKTGSTTANRIAELTGLKRSTAYDNLALLMNKGLASKTIKGRVTYYLAAGPKKLIRLLEEKKARLQKILPELEALQGKTKDKTGVTFFEGKKGVLTVLNDILDEGKPLSFYGSRKMALIALRHFPENFIQKRAEQKIPLKAVLAEEDRGDPAYLDKKIFGLSELRFFKGFDQISTNVFIYSDRVAFMTSTENPVGIIVKDSNVVMQQKRLFEIFWDLAEKS